LAAMSTETPTSAPLVLLVDDDEDSRFLYAEFLVDVSGFRVVEAGDGQRAVDMAIELKPDVVVMDVSLPVLDGRAARRALRSDPRTTAIPVVALTGFSEVGGANDPATRFEAVLVKPCLPDALAQAIRSLLAV
jgi:CheY-like chemotaxis protein